MSNIVINPYNFAVAADIELDDQVSTDSAVNGTTLTASLTVASNSNRILIVSANAYASSPTITGITFGAQALTQGNTEIYLADGRADLWYLINPNVGTYTITVTWSGTAGRRTMGGYSFYNVDQSSPIGVTDSTTGSLSPAGGTITPTTIGSMIIDSIMWTTGSAASLSLTAGYCIFIGGSDRVGGSQFSLTPTISVSNTMNYTNSAADGTWAWCSMEVKRA